MPKLASEPLDVIMKDDYLFTCDECLKEFGQYKAQEQPKDLTSEILNNLI